MKWRLKRLWWVAGGAAAVVLLGYAFMPASIEVDLAEVVRGPIEVTVEEEGRTRVRERYVVSAPLSGNLLRVELDPGDDVEGGRTVLATIEPTAPGLLDARSVAEAGARVQASEAAVGRAQAGVSSARAEMEFAASQRERVERAFERGAASPGERDEAILLHRSRVESYESAQWAEQIARFELEQARAALRRFETEVSAEAEQWRFTIRSPVDGQVLRVFQESAAVVTPGTALVEIGNPRELEVVVDVLSTDAVRIGPGDEAWIERWGGEEALRAVVRRVEPAAFTKVSALGVEEQRVNVILDLMSDEEEVEGGGGARAADAAVALGDGYRIDARIVVWSAEDVVKVPTGALFRDGGRWAVFRLSEGRAALTPVVLGARGRFEAQVLEGLEAGDRVVLYPSDRIGDGTRITGR